MIDLLYKPPIAHVVYSSALPMLYGMAINQCFAGLLHNVTILWCCDCVLEALVRTSTALSRLYEENLGRCGPNDYNYIYAYIG